MDIRDKNIASQIIEDIEAEQTEKRRIAEYKSYKVASGAQLQYTTLALKELFPQSYQTMRISDVSVSRKVLNKVSKAYKEKPIRTMGDSTEALTEVYDNGGFNRTFQEFERDFNRQKYGLLWVNNINDKISLHSLKGFESFVIIGKGGKLDGVILNYPDTDITTTSTSDTDYMEQMVAESQDDSSAGTRVYAMWTAQHHSVWKVKLEKGLNGKLAKNIINIPLDGNVSGVNPLGIIPFVFATQSSSPDLPFINPITEQSITINLLMSDVLSSASIQGYGQLVVRMPEGYELNKLHTGMTTAINLPLVEGNENQADASYINANPDLAGMNDVVEKYISEVLGEHGITGGQTAGAFNSGLERLIANADVTDIVNANQSYFSDIESQVVEIVKRWGEVTGQFKLGDDDFNVVFPKSKITISDKETLENIEKRLSLGLMTEVEALQVIDPNLDDEAAQEKLENIKKERESKIGGFLDGGQSNEAPKVRPQERQEQE